MLICCNSIYIQMVIHCHVTPWSLIIVLPQFPGAFFCWIWAVFSPPYSLSRISRDNVLKKPQNQQNKTKNPKHQQNQPINVKWLTNNVACFLELSVYVTLFFLSFLLTCLEQVQIFVFPSDMYWVYQRRAQCYFRGKWMIFCNVREKILKFPNIGSKWVKKKEKVFNYLE